MASFKIDIPRRPCYVGEERALFHGWFQESQIVPPSNLIGGHNGGVVSAVLGVVEFGNGKVRKVYPEDIQFADGNNFGDYAFFPKEALGGSDT